MAGSDNICTPGEAWLDSVHSDVWDPDTQRWQPAGDLPRPRDRFVLVSLPHGSALAVGGTTDDPDAPQSFLSTFRFDPGTSRWERSGDLTVARSNPSGSALRDGRVLIAGGYFVDRGAGAERVHGSAEIFDAESGTWSRTGALVEPRAGAGAVTLADGRVLIVGGFARSGVAYFQLEDPLASAELFDPTTGTWSSTGRLPSTDGSPALGGAVPPALVALHDGGALLVAGSTALRLDVGSGTWTATGPMVSDFEGRTLVALADGRVLAAGGTVADRFEPYSRRAEVYDPSTNRWLATKRMPAPRAYATGLLLEDGSVLVAGGGTETILGAPSCPAPAYDTFRFVPGDVPEARS
jgi:N-acetylneuraminic acid mutarotase